MYALHYISYVIVVTTGSGGGREGTGRAGEKESGSRPPIDSDDMRFGQVTVTTMTAGFGGGGEMSNYGVVYDMFGAVGKWSNDENIHRENRRFRTFPPPIHFPGGGGVRPRNRVCSAHL